MRYLFPVILLVALLTSLSFWGKAYSLAIRPQATFYPRNDRPPVTYLPGALDLRGKQVAILGWDTEEIKGEDVVRLVNDERLKVGSPALVINSKLAQAATMRAETILKHENFSHYDPYEHIQLDTVLPRVNYLFGYATENIGLDQNTAPGIVSGFMHSPSHRQNLLDKNLKETGVGVKKGWFKGNFVVIVVQLFASPAREEVYLGYSKSDVALVRGLLAGVGGELERTGKLLAQNPGSSYYRGWLELLTKQKDRLSEVYSWMVTEKPYQQRHYDTIASYNAAWASAPK